jgi:hypothetical protein
MHFHEAVEAAVLPAVERILQRRRRAMKLDRLRPWDTAVDPLGRPALKPFDDMESFVGRAASVFGQVDPDFRKYYEVMVDAKLLDLDNRKGKAPGAYSQTLAFRKQPLIFMNAVGVDDDVRTLLHESGHAFHSFEAARLPILFQRHPGSEMAEVASMSMELLAAPYIDKKSGGYYSADEQRRSRVSTSRGSSSFLRIAPRSMHSSSGSMSARPAVTVTLAMPNGSSCARASRAPLSIGVGWTKNASRAGTSSRIFSPVRFITSSTGSPSWGPCRFGATA